MKQKEKIHWSLKKILLFPLWLLAMAFATAANGQALLVSNYGGTDQNLVLQIGTDTIRVPVKAGTMVTVPVPPAVGMSINTDDPGSWGWSGFTGPDVGQATYITVTGGNAYFMGDNWYAYPTGGVSGSGGGGGGSSLAIPDQVELFMYGFYFGAALEIFGMMWRTFKNRTQTSIE